MAYKDSDELKTDERYSLGDYSFRIERTSVPGSSNDKIEAICTQGGKNARKSIQLPSATNLDGYFVEANEDTADVYVLVQSPEGVSGGLLPPGTSINFTDSVVATYELINPQDNTLWFLGYDGVLGAAVNGKLLVAGTTNSTFSYNQVMLAKGTGAPTEIKYPNTNILGQPYTYNGKTVWYNTSLSAPSGQEWAGVKVNRVPTQSINASFDAIAWSMVYGTISDGNPKQVLVGRFKINLEDAGGDGPGSDWTDPGDYDPDWEEGDPTHTLYVEVTGALSGRHNDPIVDPSYSYIPADKDTVKDYGCGGDGGHGGGGGAGASTVVIHKFATNQANSKEVTALARRHGYGSGGGKGGKGGDGCILVYY